MLVVSGTKRSGTSLLVQLLGAAGFPVLGEAFPEAFAPSLHAANPRGFFETTRLRDGVHHETNPDPETGAYLHPADTRRHVLKVFTPGLTKTDLAYLDRVVVALRAPGPFARSVARLQSLDVGMVAHPLEPHLEWWRDTHAALFDALLRRYPVLFVDFDGLLADPTGETRRIVDFIGEGDADAAAAAVEPDLRTAPATTPLELPSRHAHLADTFASLHGVLRDRRPLEDRLLDAFDAAHRELAPEIEAHFVRVVRSRLAQGLAAIDSEGEA